MDKLNGLNEIINKNLSFIKVNNSLRDQIRKKIDKSNSKHKKLVLVPAACILVMLLLTTNVWGIEILEGFQPILKYIPGINKLLVENKDADTYALAGTITIKSSDGDEHIKVLSCFTQANIVKTVLQSNIPIKDNASISIKGMDGKGKYGKVTGFNIMGDGKKGSPDYEWIGNVDFEFDNPLENFDLIIEEYKIPIIMLKVEGINDFKEFGNMSYINGIKIAIITEYIDNLLEVRIVGLSDDNKKISSYGDIYLLDKSNHRYLPVTPPNSNADSKENTFYFKARLKDDLRLYIPYIILTSDEKIDIHLDIPQSKDKEAIALPFDNGHYGTRIIKWQRIINEGNFTYRQPEVNDKKIISYSKNALEIVIDKKFDYMMKNGLYNFSYNCNNEYLSISDYQDGKKIHYVPGVNSSNKKFSEPRYQIICLPNFPLERESLDITFCDPQYYHKGDWIIPLKK